jgi:hypothetical protein
MRNRSLEDALPCAVMEGKERRDAISASLAGAPPGKAKL